MDHKTNQSRGYGFVRYNDYESQEQCLREPCHMILDRKVSVKVPDSQQQVRTTGVWLKKQIDH